MGLVKMTGLRFSCDRGLTKHSDASHRIMGWIHRENTGGSACWYSNTMIDSATQADKGEREGEGERKEKEGDAERRKKGGKER